MIEKAEEILDDSNMMMLNFDKLDVESFDVMDIYGALEGFKEGGVKYYNKMFIVITGYDDDQRELYEIPEVRKFMLFLANCCPYWFFWLKNDAPLNISPFILFLACVYPIDSIDKRNGRVFIKYDIKIMAELTEKYLHYFNQIADASGLAEEEIFRASENILNIVSRYSES